jgi:hypothetical protein
LTGGDSGAGCFVAPAPFCIPTCQPYKLAYVHSSHSPAVQPTQDIGTGVDRFADWANCITGGGRWVWGIGSGLCEWRVHF